MLNRFARGASLSIAPGPVTLKGLYTQDTSSVAQSSFGGEIAYSPISPLSFALSVLQTCFPEKSEKILQTSSSELSHSLMGTWKDKKWGDHTAEYAKTGPVFTASQQNTSYYFYSRATPFTNTWYALQAIYAQPDFVGYYQDTRQLYASLGFPLIDRMQGTLAYNKIAYNLKSLPQNGSSPRSDNVYAGLSYSFPFGLYTAIYYNFLQSKDTLTQLGYQTQYATLNGGQTFDHWTLQGIVEYGRYKDLPQALFERSWQNYQIYVYYQPSARQQYAIYTRIGYVQLAQQIQWARIYGGSFTLSLTQSLQWQFLYEYTDQSSSRNYFSTKLQYSFANRHSLELQGYINNQSHQANVTEFLLSYSIPWGLPIRKKKSQANIQGKIYQKEPEKPDTPWPNLVVHCNGMRTLTDKKGRFTFPGLTAGDYYLWVEEKNSGWTPSRPLPEAIHLEKGDFQEVNLCFEHPASLEGTLLLDTDSQEPLPRVSLLLESSATHERFFASTNEQGRFSFESLAPGRWILKVITSSLPSQYYVEEEALVIDLFPGEDKSMTWKALPVQREMRLIDVDTLKATD